MTRVILDAECAYDFYIPAPVRFGQVMLVEHGDPSDGSFRVHIAGRGYRCPDVVEMSTCGQGFELRAMCNDVHVDGSPMWCMTRMMQAGPRSS